MYFHDRHACCLYYDFHLNLVSCSSVPRSTRECGLLTKALPDCDIRSYHCVYERATSGALLMDVNYSQFDLFSHTFSNGWQPPKACLKGLKNMAKLKSRCLASLSSSVCNASG